ncbi:MAG: sugar transferase [Rhodobacteraceae bacterium]|nr:sugar transferase [Paracoccaceae bacterium]
MAKTISSDTRTYTRAHPAIDGWRLLDIGLALAVLPVLVPMIALVGLVVLLADGRPVIYRSERMRSLSDAFWLLKFRTMRPDPFDAGASGGHKACRVTRLGRWLRRTRLDELPQIWNVLRGDVGFVGPRPPLREHVRRFPHVYARVLRVRPGITGLATLCFHQQEGRLLSQTPTAAETEAIYARICIPRKARIDAIWAANRSLALDFAIMAGTVWPRHGSFRHRVRSGVLAVIVALFLINPALIAAALWFSMVES